MTTAACSICHRHRPGATLQAGGTVGLCHQDCFDAFDRSDEAASLTLAVFLSTLPPAPDRRPRRAA